ncbi:MAG TPA: methyl-accepting chemotaxis protein, partial [Arenimonas sp.]|nr:methyl-accepting chemotaxis protein [Arenimonas sp.]
RRADEATRIRQALDVASTSVMVTDNDFCVLYANHALAQMMRAAEADIRRQHPAFRAESLLGCGIDGLFENPAQQRKLLADLRQPQKSVEEIGGRSMELVITPVIADDGKQRLGFVVEWKDRTAEIAVEREIAQVVRAAADGDFSQRIRLDGKQGFVRVLSENVDHLLEAADLALNELQAVLAALAEGDLTRSIRIEFEGRFGQMSDNANRTVAQLGSMIRQIQGSASTIATAASEIASGNADLSTRTEEQAANVEEAASSMEELTSTVKQNAANSQAARQLAAGAADVANRGGQVVGQVVETMSAINADSQKIAEIIAVIDGIAFQTNILALNAAVEAARAGEQGRGFAVVASEVRALAQRSASAAKEIRALIDESVGRVESGAELVDQAGKTIAEVVAAVHKVSDLVAEIAAASQEQSGGIEQVNHTIAHIDEATQQNAALVEEASAAARTMEHEADGLAKAVSSFRLG